MSQRSAALALLFLLVPLSAAAQTTDETVSLNTSEDALSDTAPDDTLDGDADGAVADGEDDDASSMQPLSRRENRIRDHAVGVGLYYTHLQWKDNTTDTFPNYDMYSLAIRYAYYVGQAEGFGFMINSAVYVPMRISQDGIVTDPALNTTFTVRDTYSDRHVGFDLSFMAGTHRMLTENLAMIAGLGMHVGIVKLNDEALSIHEYIAVGIAAAFSLRYHLGDLWTVGADLTASSDYRDMIDHQSPLDWTINVGLTATAGLHF